MGNFFPRKLKTANVYHYLVYSGLAFRGDSAAVTFDPAQLSAPATLSPPPSSSRLAFAARNVERRIKEYNGTICEVIGAEAAVPGTAEVSEAIFFYSFIMAENERRVKNILHSFFLPRTDPGR